MNLEQKAKEFATEAHKGQFRKDGLTPYITHPEAVVDLLNKIYIQDKDIICAGYLHDTLEDCNVTEEVLRGEFNPNVARIVSALTRDVERDEYKKRIKSSDYSVKIVKLADMVHNCSTLDSSLSEKTIRRKVEDCQSFYFDLAKEVCPEFYQLLHKHIDKWIDSTLR